MHATAAQLAELVAFIKAQVGTSLATVRVGSAAAHPKVFVGGDFNMDKLDGGSSTE
jgi:hypothetical protein